MIVLILLVLLIAWMFYNMQKQKAERSAGMGGVFGRVLGMMEMLSPF